MRTLRKLPVDYPIQKEDALSKKREQPRRLLALSPKTKLTDTKQPTTRDRSVKVTPMESSKGAKNAPAPSKPAKPVTDGAASSGPKEKIDTNMSNMHEMLTVSLQQAHEEMKETLDYIIEMNKRRNKVTHKVPNFPAPVISVTCCKKTNSATKKLKSRPASKETIEKEVHTFEGNMKLVKDNFNVLLKAPSKFTSNSHIDLDISVPFLHAEKPDIPNKPNISDLTLSKPYRCKNMHSCKSESSSHSTSKKVKTKQDIPSKDEEVVSLNQSTIMGKVFSDGSQRGNRFAHDSEHITTNKSTIESNRNKIHNKKSIRVKSVGSPRLPAITKLSNESGSISDIKSSILDDTISLIESPEKSDSTVNEKQSNEKDSSKSLKFSSNEAPSYKPPMLIEETEELEAISIAEVKPIIAQAIIEETPDNDKLIETNEEKNNKEKRVTFKEEVIVRDYEPETPTTSLRDEFAEEPTHACTTLKIVKKCAVKHIVEECTVEQIAESVIVESIINKASSVNNYQDVGVNTAFAVQDSFITPTLVQPVEVKVYTKIDESVMKPFKDIVMDVIEEKVFKSIGDKVLKPIGAKINELMEMKSSLSKLKKGLRGQKVPVKAPLPKNTKPPKNAMPPKAPEPKAPLQKASSMKVSPMKVSQIKVWPINVSPPKVSPPKASPIKVSPTKASLTKTPPPIRKEPIVTKLTREAVEALKNDKFEIVCQRDEGCSEIYQYQESSDDEYYDFKNASDTDDSDCFVDAEDNMMSEECANYEKDVHKLDALVSEIKSACYVADELPKITSASSTHLQGVFVRLKSAISDFQDKYKLQSHLIDSVKEKISLSEQSKIMRICQDDGDNNLIIYDSEQRSPRCDDKEEKGAAPQYGAEGDHSTEFAITDLRRIGPTSILIKWSVPKRGDIMGYEICVNGAVKNRVFNPLRTAAILDMLKIKSEIKIATYAVNANGRCHPAATVLYKML